MSNKVATRNATPAKVKTIAIASNQDKERTVDVSTGMVSLLYYESILQDSVRATVIYGDSGNSIDEKTVIDGLPLVGQEKVTLKFEDNNKVEMDLTLYVNKIEPFLDDSTRSGVALDLASKEFFMNEKVRIGRRFDGKVSEHVKTILTEVLKSEKDLDIEETQNNYNFLGLNKKPFYMLNYLSKACVPSTENSSGNTAGFFFYETSEGIKFKSIDK